MSIIRRNPEHAEGPANARNPEHAVNAAPRPRRSVSTVLVLGVAGLLGVVYVLPFVRFHSAIAAS